MLLAMMVGNANAAASECTTTSGTDKDGAGSGGGPATGFMNSVTNSAADGCDCVTGYSTDGTTVATDNEQSCDFCIAGYVFEAGVGETLETGACVPAALNSFHAGLYDFSSAHAAINTETATLCPFAGTTDATGKAAVGDCTAVGTTTVGAAFKKVSGTVHCNTKYYGTPKDTHNDILLAPAIGCTKCPFNGALGAGTGTALASCNPENAAGTVNSVEAGGTVVCATSYYGAPKDAEGAEVAVATEGCTKCPFAGASTQGDLLLTDCNPAAYTTNGADGTGTSAGLTVCAVGYYGSPLDSNDATVLVASKGCTACPTGSTSVLGTTTLAGCTVNAGKYIKVKATSAVDATSLEIATTVANSYSAGGASASEQVATLVAATAVACPYGGTSAVGSDAQADCTPPAVSSDAFLVNAGGTTVCLANYYGVPKDANDALLAVATKGCTACPTNTASAQGTATLAGCTVKAGYYIATKANSATDATSLVISATLANFYSVGGEYATIQEATKVAATSTACPFGGVSTAGSDALTDCNPVNALSTVNSVEVGGTVICKTNFYGSPKDANGAELAVATQGCTPCPFGGASTQGDLLLADCNPAAYTTNGADGTGTSAGLTVCAVGYYGSPLDTNDATVLGASKGCTVCPLDTTSLAGTTTLAGCTVPAGKYITTLSDSASVATNLALGATQANFYSLGDVSATGTRTAADSQTACPYGGTVGGTGTSVLADCVPKCGSIATEVSSDGTCTCKANSAGTPTPLTGIVTGGCTLSGACAANEHVESNFCKACAAGTTRAAGDITSRADTACDKTLCAVDEYVSSNVCTACPAGMTNAAGDDASGADTTCGECAANYFVSVVGGGGTAVGTCTACSVGSTNAAGDDNTASGTATSGCGECALDYYVFLLGAGTDVGRCDKCAAAGTTIAAGGINTATGALTVCAGIKCAVNEYVSSNVCTACAAGTTIAKDGDATGADTVCAKTKCAVNEYVKTNVCIACAAGTTIAKDGDASGADTVCAKTKCAVNEYVKSNVCTACAAGSTNAVGDDASGADTACDADVVSSASRAEISFATILVLTTTLLACLAL